jgi:hypothetical protein
LDILLLEVEDDADAAAAAAWGVAVKEGVITFYFFTTVCLWILFCDFPRSLASVLSSPNLCEAGFALLWRQS